MKFHKYLSQEKWNIYHKTQQILMIGSEIGRAKSWIKNCDPKEVQNSYIRAIELLDLTINDPKWKSGLKELLRFKEVLGEGYLFRNDDLPFCLSLYKVLLSWSGITQKCKYE